MDNLQCVKCGEEVSAAQYDAYLGLCPQCCADEEDDADQHGLAGLPHQ